MVNNKIAQRAVAAGLSGLMAFGAAAPAALATGIQVKRFDWYNKNSSDDGDFFKRLGGDTRYDTMKKIVEAYNDMSWEGARATILGGLGNRDVWNYHSTAVVASGDNFPDALAANGLAGYMTNEGLTSNTFTNNVAVPVILTKSGTLSNQAKDLLKNMQVQNVVIMGGTAAVSQDVENAINNMGIGTQRVAGKDRQETSLKALQRINGNWNGRKGTYDLIIATGDNYADALSISPYAYRMGTPILLTKKDGTLTDEQVKAIKANDKIAEIVIVGGTAAVSDTVMGQIGTVRNNNYGIHYTRIAGADRYETSAKIAEFEVASWADYYNQLWTSRRNFNTYQNYPGSIWEFLGVNNGFSFDHVVVATGENFPDALVGGQLAGGIGYTTVDGFEGTAWNPCPLLLTKDGDTRAENVISSQISKNRVSVDRDYYFSRDSWNKYVREHYLNTGTAGEAYDQLINAWYTYATNWSDYTKALAYEEFPFFVNIDYLLNRINKNDVEVTKFAEFTYRITQQQDGSVVFEYVSKSPDIKTLDFKGTTIEVTYTDEAAAKYKVPNKKTLTAAEMTTLVGADWDKVTGTDKNVRYEVAKVTEPASGTIDDKAVIRYVGETENFYGIILGGTSAVSNKKRDDLDKAVATHLSVLPLVDDVVWWGTEYYGVNLEYTRLVYLDTVGDLDRFTTVATVQGTKNIVTYNTKTGVWSLEI